MRYDRYYRVYEATIDSKMGKTRFESVSQNEATEFWKRLIEKGILAGIDEIKR